ncbi:unnamed protein product [Caenorhabditis sp. 36 PRJEB53466]|nr:unnamed protein product [Caenorhabditis sp. 36 PRJEB53466]
MLMDMPYRSKATSTAKAYREGEEPSKKRVVLPTRDAKRRLECPVKKKPIEVTIEDVEKITQIAMQSNSPTCDRDALLAILSFHVMLRASEAEEIRWDDVIQSGDLIEVVVKRTKNDQMGLGRSSFFHYTPGSDADILMCRWRLRNKKRTCEYVFSNADGSRRLTEQSISAAATKMLKLVGKAGATHHGFRRGGANHLRAQGHSLEEIRTRGRWRSMTGLQRYLKDIPEAQGCKSTMRTRGGLEELEESDEE